MDSVQALVERIIDVIVNPIIGFLWVLALALFLWGGANFILNINQGDEAREKGKRHMLWGVVGMFIMFSVWGILNILADTFSFQLPG